MNHRDTKRAKDASNWRDVERQAVTLIDKGHLLQQLGQDEKALISFDKAVTICRLLSESSDEVALVLAQALDNKGNALVELERVAEALPAYDEAIRVHEGLIRGDGVWSDVREIGISVMNNGRALMIVGRFDEARVCLERAIEYFERCQSEKDLALAWLNTGESYVRQDRLPEALPALDKSLALWEAVASSEPNAAKADYAYTLSSKADVLLRLGRSQEALKLSKRSIANHRAVVKHTNSPRDRKAMAEAVNLQGHILTKLGHTKEAQACFHEAAKLKGAMDA